MSLKEKLLNDLKLAMKNKEEIKKNAVQMVRAAILQVEKDNKITLDDDAIIDIIQKEIKMKKDALPDYERSDRQEMVEALKSEISLLYEYLPKQLTEEELEVIVRDIMQEIKVESIKDMGRLMQACMARVKGQTDGKTISKIAKKFLD